ncbi:hypothetical protein DSECCO2_382980 [anaerobic digester metagenome]
MPAQSLSAFIGLGHHHHGIPTDECRNIASNKRIFGWDDSRVVYGCIYIRADHPGRGDNPFASSGLGKLRKQIISLLIAFFLNYTF